MPASAIRLGDLVAQSAARFETEQLAYGHGTESAWDEAVALVLGVTGLEDDATLLDNMIEASTVLRVNELVTARIETRQPLAYLLGSCQYMGLRFSVRPGVLVPRSPLGYLLHEGLQPWLPEPVQTIVDLCAGSGCLGIVAAHLHPAARVELVELDPLACEVAEENIRRHGLSHRVRVVEGDALEVLESATDIDLLITNPPYVNGHDMQDLPAEYRAEPQHALSAGEDGLDLLLPIVQRAPQVLGPQGVLLGEAGGSAQALDLACEQYALIWLDLPAGGEGVFLWSNAA